MRSQHCALLIASRADLWPPHHGAAVRIVNCARFESLRFRRVVIVTPDTARHFELHDGRLQEHPYPRAIRLAAHLLRALSCWRWRLLRRGIPFDETVFMEPIFDVGYRLQLLYVGWRYRPKFLQAEFPWFAVPCFPLARHLGARVLVSEHNVEFERIRSIYRDLPRAAARWIRERELSICRSADAIATVSELDKATLVAEGLPPDKVVVAPNGVDFESFTRCDGRSLRQILQIPDESKILIFHGTLWYPPNRRALAILASEILPRIEARGVTALLVAIGEYPPGFVFPAKVRSLGPVDDLAAHLRGADLAIVPLTSGGGTPIKIIEYFAARVPVIASTTSVCGLAVQAGVHLYVEDNWDRIADRAVKILRNPAAGDAMTGRAFEVASRSDWSRTADILVDAHTRA